MSNRRRTGLKNLYRDEFLHSRAWFDRRERWFRDHAKAKTVPCAACGRAGSKRELELHHLDYRGVRIIRGEWQAWEDDDDLVAMHPYCHELLHRLIDRDIILAKHRTRRQASAHALQMLQMKLHAVKDAS